ncbi:MAG: VCBS repeat-containing protein [Planctomycetota bacterium]
MSHHVSVIRSLSRWVVLCCFFVDGTASCWATDIDQPWTRHVIDDSSRGADGTRLVDANGDGLLDVTTGWEQGGITRIYLNPGSSLVKQTWPAVTVGIADSVEDAVFADLDGDGAMDVISSCEGARQVMLVHWAPKPNAMKPDRYLDADAWKTQSIPRSEDRFRWMYASPMDVDQDGQIDLVAGGKGNGSQLGWWKVPKDRPRDLDAWVWHPLRESLGWLMTIDPVDMDGDGDLDILFTDRKGKRSGCYWLENPGSHDVMKSWREHAIAGQGREVMFLTQDDIDQDGDQDLIVSIRPQAILICLRNDATGLNWDQLEVRIPTTYGSAKAAAAADLNRDGVMELAFTTERATDGKVGVGRITQPLSDSPRFTSISGVDGIKHDLIQLIDLDEDGDLDVMTCEEAKNLGVIWYENPLLRRSGQQPR